MRLFLIYRCRRSRGRLYYVTQNLLQVLRHNVFLYNMDDAFIYCGGHYSRTRTRTRKLLPTVDIF